FRASALGRLDGDLRARDRLWLIVSAATVVIITVASVLLATSGHGLIAALLPALLLVCYLAWPEARSHRADAGLRLFLLSLIGLGLGLSIGVDLVTLNGDISRMNTVFKFYEHIWVVFALAASFAVWQLAIRFWTAITRPGVQLRWA